jgi:hypothetical protein
MKFIEQFGEMEWSPQGLKPNCFAIFTARLKSCPDTKPKNIPLTNF